MTKYYVNISKSFNIDINGTESEAIEDAFAQLIEGLTTGKIKKNQFEVESWEEK